MAATQPCSPEMLQRMDAYWRASNYLAVGQIYLKDNPLLRQPLTLDHIKPQVGHWGTVPGQNFIYVHLNRAIVQHGLNMLYVSGPGHGGAAIVGQVYLEGTWSEVYPGITQDLDGLQKLFKQFSFPGGVSSHVAPSTPGSIHEGGELGYSLSHAMGAVLDNPSLVVACVVGDGEAETGPLATSWQASRFLNPVTDGAVLPILHLNGYKISNPSLLARIGHDALTHYLVGCGWAPIFVEGHEPMAMHRRMADTLDQAIQQIHQIQADARETAARAAATARSIGEPAGAVPMPAWPMIVLRSPKGWTGPAVVDGRPVEDTFRSHGVPLFVTQQVPAHLAQLERWMRSYRPQELFDAQGRLLPELADLAPKGHQRMGANPHANGGLLLQDLQMPDFRMHARQVNAPGAVQAQDTLVLGDFLRDIMRLNRAARHFRLFGPDETVSNLLGAVLQASPRQWCAERLDTDEFLAPEGLVMDAMLSEHQCQGWLEGYLLTGRHGLFNSYEAFIRIIDSMFTQHAKWLKVTRELPWRRPVASLNYLLASHVWQQDHNGYTHQDPGFIDHVVNKKADIVRVYLPPDANCLLSVMDHCLRTRHLVNVVVAGKHAMPQWLTLDEAIVHCAKGIGIWRWASNDSHPATDLAVSGGRGRSGPDIVLACCGNTPTLEILATAALLREHLPALRLRVVNVVDLMKLQSDSVHPHGLSDADFDALFTRDTHVVMAFHGYAPLVHQLTHRRANRRIHVHGYREECNFTTPFDIRVQNQMDRFHLVQKVLSCLPDQGSPGSYLRQFTQDKLIEHTRHIRQHGQDLPEIRDWQWGAPHSGTDG